MPFSCCLSGTDSPSHVSDPGLVNIMCGFGVQEMKSSEVASKIYRGGCIQSIQVYVEQNLTLVGGIALGVALAQLLGKNN